MAKIKKNPLKSQHIIERAVILRHYPMGEADRLVILLGENKGRIAAWARSARKPGGRLTALTEPFIEGRYALKIGPKHIYISQGEMMANNYGLRGDIELFTAACVMVELADQGVPENLPALDFVNLLSQSLEYLQKNKDSKEALYIYGSKFARFQGIHPWSEEQSKASGDTLENKLRRLMSWIYGNLELKDNAWQSFLGDFMK